jgi:hypothetical protein
MRLAILPSESEQSVIYRYQPWNLFSGSPCLYLMSSSEATLDMGVKRFRSTDGTSDGSPEAASSSTAGFYQADLDKVERKLSGVHVHMYVISVVLCIIVLHGSLRN